MKIKGFSLIEILISIVIVTIGILGLQVMQARSSGYIIENNKYSMAVELANEYVDLVRSYKYKVYSNTVPEELYYQRLTKNNLFWENNKIVKSSGTCTSISTGDANSDIKNRLKCWNEKADNAGIKESLITIISGRDVLDVTLFWDSIENTNGSFKCYSEKGSAADKDKCSYTVRVEI